MAQLSKENTTSKLTTTEPYGLDGTGSISSMLDQAFNQTNYIPFIPVTPQIVNTTTRVVNKTRVAIAIGAIILIIGTIIYLKKRKGK